MRETAGWMRWPSASKSSRPSCAADDDLTVEHVAARREHQLGEVAPEWLGRARLQEHLLAVDERQAAKPVELDLVGKVLADGQLLARERQLGLDRRLQRKTHSSSPLSSRFARLGWTRVGSPGIFG